MKAPWPAQTPHPIVALDVPSLSAAKDLVRRLGPEPDFYKVGLQLYTKEGPAVVEWLRGEGKQVFLDLKLHDIPNTVRGATQSAVALGVQLLTVHAIGGVEMMEAAVQATAGTGTGILAVTVLTSFDEPAYGDAIGAPGIKLGNAVLRLAAAAAKAGVVGVVCAGAEAAAVRAAHGSDFATLVPGLRPPGTDANDQSRTTTAEELRAVGATWTIVGRAVTGAKDPAAAYRSIQAALSGKNA
jgi:orotidine-5'-phosphate decarboxylase